ncbi:hypothetical protein PHET_10407 [Paragonimus heterotremus]|uniref:Uncharacterized protein n=1 Tax=Paragonimus heterotremus TaxID=100268 RepID=A0A8J4TAA9_9TREM|nr:hypothetical protein PHET_10407 [Paragonimus heterotremus]
MLDFTCTVINFEIFVLQNGSNQLVGRCLAHLLKLQLSSLYKTM